MSELVITSVGPDNITASTVVSVGPTRLAGIFVASVAGGQAIAVFDSATAATTATVVAQFTPSAATWYPMPFLLKNGLYVQIGGTLNCTVAAEKE